MKTIVYVDGFNLFYGLLKGTPNLWLDLELFARSLLTDKYEIAEIKYFTARVRGEPLDAISANDQYRYLCALANNPIVKICLSAGALCYRAWAQSWSSAGVEAHSVHPSTGLQAPAGSQPLSPAFRALGSKPGIKVLPGAH